MKIKATRLRLGGLSNLRVTCDLLATNCIHGDKKRTVALFGGLPCVFRAFMQVTSLAGHLLRLRQLRLDQVLDVALQSLGYLVQLVNVPWYPEPSGPCFQGPNGDTAPPGQFSPADPGLNASAIYPGHVFGNRHFSHSPTSFPTIIMRSYGNVNLQNNHTSAWKFVQFSLLYSMRLYGSI